MMKLLLIAAVAFALVVCQAEARGKDSWPEIMQNYDSTGAPRGMGHRVHHIHRQRHATKDGQMVNRLRMEISKTLVDKVKILVQGAVALLELIEKVTDKIASPTLSQLIDNMIDALNKFSDSIIKSEASSNSGNGSAPEVSEEETGSGPATPAPTPPAAPAPPRSSGYKSYSTRCRQDDPRPRCQRNNYRG